MKSILGTLAMCFALGAALPAQAAVLYSTDDGVGELPGGGGPPIPADIWWAQSFDTAAGGTVITDLQVAFGSALAGQRVGVNGAPVQVFLYDDSDNDGDPNTGLVRLQTVSSTVQSANTNTFVNFAIPPTAVSGKFFVAALVSDTGFDASTGTLAPNGMPAGFDQSSSAGTSWVADSSSGNIDPDNVPGTANLSGSIINLATFGLPGNLMLRAVGVPEPSTILLLLAGASVLGLRRR
ncbi:MAG: hypothetical protein CMJ58_27065 [Planctomycetaceae bacterium]|nr:hypothetical protein [Planctomycetaceae bacterium]